LCLTAGFEDIEIILRDALIKKENQPLLRKFCKSID